MTTPNQNISKFTLNSSYAPLVTVITAVFNGAQTIESSIRSVRNQSYPNIEYIIIDGGSKDGTLEIIKKNSDCIAKWVSEQDKGIYDAFNKGLKISKGEWICFLGCDDMLIEDALSSYYDLGFFNRAQIQFEYVSGKALFVDANGENIQLVGKPWVWGEFKRGMTTSHTGAIHHRSLFERYGFYDTTFKIAGDYELLLRPNSRLKAAYVDKCITIELNTGVSNTSNEVFFEAYRAKLKNKCRNRLLLIFDLIFSLAKFRIIRIWYE